MEVFRKNFRPFLIGEHPNFAVVDHEEMHKGFDGFRFFFNGFFNGLVLNVTWLVCCSLFHWLLLDLIFARLLLFVILFWLRSCILLASSLSHGWLFALW